MSVLNDNYKRIISEIEEKVSNPEELEFVKQKMAELSMMFMNVIETITETTEEKIREIEEKQNVIETKMNKVEKAVSEIESDIYSDEESSFEFEIVCPYCNNEFITEFNNDEDMKKEIECPECHNIIELDWNGEEDEEECTGHCCSCHGCDEDEYEEYDEEDSQDEDDM